MPLPPLAAALQGWIDRNFLELGRQMRLSYLPPLMVYVAAGISGLTGIVGVFYVKERLGLSAEFLAALGFWGGLPWALKMPLGHLVDLIWRWKALLVYLGATLIAASLLIMIGLLDTSSALHGALLALMPVDAWYVLSALLAPVGYVVQDVVADAMTVEAVPHLDDQGQPVSDAQRRLMHTTMQTLGRVAIIGGTLIVAVMNVLLLDGVAGLAEDQRAAAYRSIYELALLIPAVSVAGVILANWLRRRDSARLARQGHSGAAIAALLGRTFERPPVNWWILLGGLAFAAVSLALGVGKVAFAQEIVFLVSMTIVLFLIGQLTHELDPAARRVLVGTAIVIFVFRAVPGPGPGATWWMIDELVFDQQFLAVLSLISSVLTLAGMFVFRRFMAERPITYIVGFLTVFGTLLSLPTLGMYYGLHQWTAAHTGGVVDARFIALVDTALESPLGQIAMIPMLAWIANSAPERLKATFFAVMASFTNLALSASQLATQYLNRLFTVTREVKDAQTGLLVTPADYSELGLLLIWATAIGFAAPMLAIGLIRMLRLRSA
ncbi:MAG: hypothetical protein JNM42_19055 [Propionivibrio sp.]|uniref:hypothetical protein n=1 Tax=Propionivibrio sp. TaxID=2212460 RepID=UPI001A3BB61C|nr:hypothetical protein [Propionivibrio sp.]MBL8416528.1 hypothetical protein [Propionivibrio sp.]